MKISNIYSLRPGRRKAFWMIGAAVLVSALAQSITITPSIRGRIVDAETLAPLADVAVAAVWNLEMPTLVDSALPGGPVKVAETSSDRDGGFQFPAAVLVHWPVLPFSLYLRSAEEMPMLIVAKQGYQVRTVLNDTLGMEGPPHGAGFLLLRSSSLQDTLVRMARWSKADIQANDRRVLAAERLARALEQCSRRLLCQKGSLQRSQQVLALSLSANHGKDSPETPRQ